jgi:hypothetical protein
MKKWSVREKRDCMTNKIMYIRILFEQLFLKKKRKVEMRNKRTIDLSSFAFVSFLSFFLFSKKKKNKIYKLSEIRFIIHQCVNL